jgi:hypothetical protein
VRKKGDDVTVERERQCGLHREREKKGEVAVKSGSKE